MALALAFGLILIANVGAADDPKEIVLKIANFPPPPRSAPAGKTLKAISSSKNDITDVDEWFVRNDLALSPYRKTPSHPIAQIGSAARTFRGYTLIEAYAGPGGMSMIYGDVDGGRFVVVADATTGVAKTIVDAHAWTKPPKIKPGDAPYVGMGIRWAVATDDVLYVSNFHRTYASSSGGFNAYVSAIDLSDGKVLWRSAALVANATNFVIVGDAIISGYGFTAEPDYVFVLDRLSGKVRARVPVKSGPEYLILKDETLYVRCYDTDYVFAIAGGLKKTP
ncbi:MAG: hypothetical protein IT350_19145 [Deltaproteobacteria bacterium]|nr:hypothetical protein [Deltaproteobacteria bacterium]